MAQTITFNKDVLDRLPKPMSGRDFYYDSKAQSLRIQVTPTGVKSFQVVRRLGGKIKFITIGRYPDLTTEQARNKARTVVSDIAHGIDPVQAKRDKQASVVTLREALESYIDTHRSLKISTADGYRNEVRLTFSDWLDRPLANINRAMALKRYQDRSAVSAASANRAYRVLRAIFNYAKHRYTTVDGDELFTSNPVDILKQVRAWNKVPRRKTYIKESDRKAWYDAVVALKNETVQEKGEVVRDFLMFLIFTGVRREEGFNLKWSDIDFDERTFTLRDTKNRETVTLPLNSAAFELMQTCRSVSSSTWVFASAGSTGRLINPTKQISRVVKASGVAFSCHDLRRTFITIGESLDISPYTLKRLVNHKSGESSDVTAGYVVPDLNRMRLASQRICDAVLASFANKSASPFTVVPNTASSLTA